VNFSRIGHTPNRKQRGPARYAADDVFAEHTGAYGQASLICSTIQRALGLRVTLKRRILLPIVADDEKAIQNTERKRRDSEEVHGSNGFAMIPQECQPALTHVRVPRHSLEPSRDRRFRNIEAKF